MKKIRLFIFGLLALAIFSSNNSFAQQLLHETFSYPLPAFIGGNGDAGSSSNNWTTHSVTTGQTTTIDLIAGSLNYTGLAASAGDKLYFFSNANATSRDVNTPITTTSTVCYYSALINIIDNTQIGATNPDYFMCLGATAGTSVTTLGARLGIKSVNTGANYRLSILNTSGGTPVYTEYTQDLNFGTTYLVVVKYDRSTTPTTAYLWINPSSLGGAEPAGSVSNNSGTNTFTAFASMCLRNSSTTPKAEIDEIRVGATWADVTPICATPAQPSVITGASAPTQGTSEIYTVDNVAGVTYAWTFPADWVPTPSTTNSITVTVGLNAGDVTCTPSNACGAGTVRTLAVTPIPNAINEYTNNNIISVFPNPTIGLVTLTFKGLNNNVKLQLHNVLGSIVFTTNFNAKSDVFTKTLDLSKYPSGMYYIQVVNNGKTYVQKIVKQ